jgi:archaellum component FlaF (FlaF/FlaG flagellin family)
MGFSVTAASAILFAAALISLGNVLVGYSTMQSYLADAQRSVFDHLQDAKNDCIRIVAVDANNSTISLLNSGGRVLLMDDLDVIVNGTMRSGDIESATVTNVGATDIWAPGEELTIRMSCNLHSGRIMVYAGSSAQAFWG